MLRVLGDPEETAPLFRALPPGALQANLDDDDSFFDGILDQIAEDGSLRGVDREALLAFPRMVFALEQQRALIGSDRFDSLVDLLVQSLADRLAGGAR